MSRAARRSEAPRRGRPVGSDSEETRRLILDTALRHFAERGYSSATLSAIAKDAGLAPSAMYHYVDGKEALYEEVFFDVAPQVWARIAERVSRATTAHEAIEIMVRGRGSQPSPYYSQFLASLPTVAVLHPEFAHLLSARAKFQGEVFRTIAELGMRTGEFDGFTVDEATEILRSIIMGWFFERYFEGETRDSAREPLMKAFERILRPMRASGEPITGDQ